VLFVSGIADAYVSSISLSSEISQAIGSTVTANLTACYQGATSGRQLIWSVNGVSFSTIFLQIDVQRGLHGFPNKLSLPLLPFNNC